MIKKNKSKLKTKKCGENRWRGEERAKGAFF